MPRSKLQQSRLDATSARSFIELGDPEGTSTPPPEERASDLTLQEVLDGAPAKARKGGCNGGGDGGGGGCSKFGHETRVVGGAGNELPPSKHVRGTELCGSRSGSLSLIPSNVDEKQSEKGVIIMTKTIQHVHEDMPQQNLSWLQLNKHGQ